MNIFLAPSPVNITLTSLLGKLIYGQKSICQKDKNPMVFLEHTGPDLCTCLCVCLCASSVIIWVFLHP